MKFFTFYDRNGKKEFVHTFVGELPEVNPDTVCIKLPPIPVMTDFYAYGFDWKYEWSPKERTWQKVGIEPKLVNLIGMVVSGNTIEYFHFELALREMMDKEKIPYIKKNEAEVLVSIKHLPAIWEIMLV